MLANCPGERHMADNAGANQLLHDPVPADAVKPARCHSRGPGWFIFPAAADTTKTKITF